MTQSLPIWVVHGADDGLIPTAFTSEPYVHWLRAEGRAPRYWKIPHAQHFDAFLALPGFGEVHTPLLPYAYRALDAMLAHVVSGNPLPDPATPQPKPRGAGPVTRATLDLPEEHPQASSRSIATESAAAGGQTLASFPRRRESSDFARPKSIQLAGSRETTHPRRLRPLALSRPPRP